MKGLRCLRAAARVGAGACVALSLILPVALAQEVQEQPAPQPPAPVTMSRTVEAVVADQIARTAIQRIREAPDPTTQDYRLLALALERALLLAPDDLHLARRAAEAWRSADDSAREIKAIRRIIRLDPADTVAQLRVTNDSIRGRQTVEERLAAYDRLLGPLGEALDPSIRSRLALDAAMIARETGDERGFLMRLSRAVELDTTNKDAAALAWRHASERVADPLERAELLAAVVLADPLDEGAHLTLSQELLSHGAFVGAGRFMDRATDVMRRIGRSPDDVTTINGLVVQWATRGGQSVLDDMAEHEAVALHRVARIDLAIERGDMEASERLTYQPSAPHEQARLAIASAMNLTEQASGAAQRLVEVGEQAERLVREDAERTGAQQAEIDREVTAIEYEMLWSRLWAGHDTQGAERALAMLVDEFDASVFLSEAAIRRARGWLAIRQGRLDEAESILAALAEEDDRSRLGLGLAMELSGRELDAVRQYAVVIRDQPGSLLGMWARTRAEAVLGQPLRPTQTASLLESFAAAVPRFIDRMTADPSSFIDLSIRHSERRADMFGRVELVIRLRNAGELPLALGENAPLNARLLLSPNFTIAGRRIHENLQPEVAILNQRLRLRPGETIEARYWVGQGDVGTLMLRNPMVAASVRWRATQGFGMTTQGAFAPGAFGVGSQSDLLNRPAPLRAPGSDSETIAVISNPDATTAERAQAVVIAGWLLSTGGGLEDQDARFELRTQLSGALASSLPSFDPLLRAWAVYMTPPSVVTPPTSVVEQAALAGGEPLTLLALLQTRAFPLGHEALERAKASDDALVREYAQTRERILESRRAAGQ